MYRIPTEQKTYYQVYAFDIMDPEQREELNTLLKTNTLAQPIEKVITEGHCTVFCIIEHTEVMQSKPVEVIPLGSLAEESAKDKNKQTNINKKNDKQPDKKQDTSIDDEVYEEKPDTPVNKLLKDVRSGGTNEPTKKDKA